MIGRNCKDAEQSLAFVHVKLVGRMWLKEDTIYEKEAEKKDSERNMSFNKNKLVIEASIPSGPKIPARRHGAEGRGREGEPRHSHHRKRVHCQLCMKIGKKRKRRPIEHENYFYLSLGLKSKNFVISPYQ